VGIIVFLIFSILTVPFAYLILIIRQAINISTLKKKTCKVLVKEFSLLLFLVFFGVLYLLVIVIIDLVHFINSLFKSKSKVIC
jgi:hypothetical protein